MNPDDVKRDQILRYLYTRHKNARGVGAIPVGIRDLQKVMKSCHNMSQQDVSHNLDYLLQKGWVCEVTKERDFMTSGGTVMSSEQVRYKISDVGIDYLESASAFKKPAILPYINITNVKGVSVVGDGNVVNIELTDLSRALSELESAIHNTEELPDEEKLDILADLSTIRDQVSKKNPDKSIIQKAWISLQSAASVASIVDLVMKVGQLVSQYVG